MSLGYDIKPVERGQRVFGFLDMFNIWFGAGISIAEFWAGAILISVLGLNVPSAILAIVIGHFIGNALLSLIGLMGEESGVPTMVLTRKSLGRKGSYMASAMNYIQLIGWTAVMLIVAALASNHVVSELSNNPVDLKWLFIVVIGLAVIWWSIIGPERWRLIEKISVIALAIVVAWLTILMFMNHDIIGLFKEPLILDHRFWLGLDLVIAMPVSWAPLIADYTRFAKRPRDAFWGSYVGYFISSTLFYVLGALSNAMANLMDPVSIIATYGLGIPAMLLIILSTTTTTFLDVYSAGISVKNILVDIDARRQIIYAGIAGILLGVFFPVEKYEWFLLMIGGAFTSLIGVMIGDYVVSRNEYMEWRDGSIPGFRKLNVAVWLIGFAMYISLAGSSLIPGLEIPVFTQIGSSLGSTIVTLLFTMLTTLIHSIIYSKKQRGNRQ
ncbi:MAG: putative hydroxymethylpyrimidine transporter CytX [Desulfurococcaceae archaeon]